MRASTRALQCRDILVEIFEHLSPDLLSQEMPVLEVWPRFKNLHRYTLASSARVCKAFSDPALDVLWRTLNDVAILLELIPTFETYIPNTSYLSLIEEAVTPATWVRVQSYARRVRELRSTNYLPRIHPSTWMMLEDVCKGSPLLPRLRQITINIDIQRPHGAMYLLSPSLETMRVSFSGSHDPDPCSSAAGVLLGLISSRLPRLSSLTVLGGLYEVESFYLDSVTRFSQLEVLHLQHSGAVVCYSTLQLISRMPALRVLDLTICFEFMDEETPLAFGNAFRAVRKVGFQGRIVDLVRVFKATSWESITELSLVGMTGASNADETREGITSICAQLPSSLRTVVLRLDDNIPLPTVSVLHLFRPFLSFSELTSFKAGLPKYIPSISDADLCAFAAAWPLLETFSLTHNMSMVVQVGHDHAVPRHRPTIHALLGFARHCPRLEVLNLPAIDVSALPPPNFIPALGRHTMRHLFIDELGGAHVTNLLDLAVILDLLFPSLQVARDARVPEQQARTYNTIDPFGRQQGKDSWDLTRKLVAAIQARREHKGPGDAPLLTDHL